MCEIFEQLPEYSSEWYLMSCDSTSVSDFDLFQAYFKCMLPDENQLKNLIDLTKGDRNLAEEIQEDFLHLGVAVLAAFTFVPLNVSDKLQTQKSKVSKHISVKLLDTANLGFTENWLTFLKHPTSSINVLKALYSLCMANSNMCAYIAKNQTHLNALCEIFSEKVKIE